MKKEIIILMLTISLTNIFGQTPNNKLEISHLTRDFYIYTTHNSYNGDLVSANGMYLVTTEGVVLFDTPWDTSQFQPLLDSIKFRHDKKVIICIATHFHKDRTAGLEYYKTRGISTYTTMQTDEWCRKRNEKRAEYLMGNDTIFKVGDYSFQTYYAGKGHSSDNIIIWFDKDKIIYGGCLVKSIEATDLGNIADGDVNEWSATIRNIQKKFKRPNFIIPGHQSWTSIKSLDHTLNLIKQFKKENAPLRL